jgi:mRNA-degrading endonuclease RelE of RelBE toxin-antitoxin system
MWHVTFTEGFKKDIERYPTTLINKLEHHLPFFRANPFQPNPAVKRLKNRTNTFRLRFGDFRLQYHVFTAGHQVVLGCLKPRQEIYRNSLPDKTPTGEDVDVLIPTITHQQPDAPEGASKEELTGLGILPEELFLIGIEKAHHKRILACHHLSDLENSQLPSPVSQRVLDYCTNPRPTHMGKLYSLDPNEHFANIGDKPLSAFLLWLDPQQQEIVNKDLNKGPLAVRGGPGTGKTLIGLHRLVQLIERRARETPPEIPVRFGFISYNKSLVG